MSGPGTPTPPSGSETVVLADGTTAELIARDDGWILEVDGIRQSHVQAAGRPPAPSTARWMLAALGPDRGRLVHLGGGLLSLPRAVADTTPGARQRVVEIDPAIAGLARDRFGLPEHVTLQTADARAWLDAGGSPPEWGEATCDAVVIDVFAGGRIPPAFTSRECFARARWLLRPDGVLVVNSVAGGGLGFLRREIATLRADAEHVAIIVQGSALGGLRFGNAILIASSAPIAADAIRAALAGDPSRGALVTDLDALVGDAEPVTDADVLWSPEPDLPDVGGALRLLDQARSLGSRFGARPAD